MKVTIINKSDSRGGAAVVSYRLMEALRAEGVEARMLVCEKLTDSPHVHVAAPAKNIRRAFLRERLDIFLHNGLNRADLFRADTGSRGLPLSSHPLVREADVVVLGWVNQGMLSLREIGRIATDRPVVWVMHDMWCATGVCHHADTCRRFSGQCGECPLLHWMQGHRDLAYRTQKAKARLYDKAGITFVAVSRWLRAKCEESSLLAEARVEVIGNAFIMPAFRFTPRRHDYPLELLMVAARLDDPIKGLHILENALLQLKERHPGLHRRLRLTLVGELRDTSWTERLCVPVTWKGSVPTDRMEEHYRAADILVSPSRYETLPGTLVEAQVYGALPVAFDSGGQRDIVTPGVDGILGVLREEPQACAREFADALVDAAGMLAATEPETLARRMYDNVESKFAAPAVARAYRELFNKLTN